ncbi:transmembrane protein 64-like [Lytechinus pictus]|uniref:transmembrane protein 64-like n=1 Tax=Lytechinus pictus TaxID=7653 RepID=UPI0030B9DF4B
MVLKCLCLGSMLSNGQSFGCCHCCMSAAGGGVSAAASSTPGHACHFGSLACCSRLPCCSRELVVSAGASGQRSCLSSVVGKLPCVKVCPRLTAYSAISLIGLSTFLLFQQEVELILSWLLDSGDAESFLFFLVLFIFLSFPMTWGYILVNVVAGYRFGLAFGTFVVIVTVAIGSVCALLVCRTLLSSLIRRNLMTEKLEMIVRVVEGDHGFQVIALTRLTPIPFGIQNGVFALSNVRVSTFMLASFLGLLPTQFLNSYMGSSLRSVQDIKDQHSSSLFFIAQVLFSFFLSVYVLRVAQRELHRKLDDHHHHTMPTPIPYQAAGSSQDKVRGQPSENQLELMSNGQTYSHNSQCNESQAIFIV